MPINLIPSVDPAPLPGPRLLFHGLWLLTFFVHLFFVNTVLGGTLLAAIARGPASRETRRLVVDVNSWTISLAITLGIAPLLFMQVLLGRFFYTATILVAWAWLGMLVLLMIGYYLNYLAKWRLRAGGSASVILSIEAACFVAIAIVQVAVNLLHMQPDRWQAVADSVLAALADPSFVPRLFHFLLAALAMSGALLAWIALRRAGRGGDPQVCAAMARLGVRSALVATALQLVDGFWLLLALPEGVLRAFMRSGATTMIPLTIGILAGVLLLVLLAQLFDPLAQPTKVRRVLELVVGAMAVMVVTRHQVRSLYLSPYRAGEAMAVIPQWGALAVFVVTLVLCLALVGYAVARSVKDRPEAGESAA